MNEADLQKLMRKARCGGGYWTRSGIVWAIKRAYAMGKKAKK